MKKFRATWSLVGLLAGIAGLATSFLVGKWMNIGFTPVSAVADLFVNIAPDRIANIRDETAHNLLVPAITAVLLLVFVVCGNVGRRDNGYAILGFGAVTAIGVVATLRENGTHVSDLTPLGVGLVTMALAFAVLAARLRRLEAVPPEERFEEPYVASRRSVLMTVAAVAGIAGLAGILGRVVGGRRDEVQAERESIAVEEFTRPVVPAGASSGVDGTVPWMTPVEDFYLIDTSFSRPAIRASDWELRIHGMVEREIVLTYNDLVPKGRQFGQSGSATAGAGGAATPDGSASSTATAPASTEAGSMTTAEGIRIDHVEDWVTLNCVSNPVGGDLIGNAWWSGALLGPIIAQAKPLPGADAILQTSEDGWTCGTPLETVMDGRNAMLALFMNGEPLTIEHGYPVRTIVPGLYGYVSGTKWVVDMEITSFDEFEAFWTQRGWGERGPVKMASRVEVPRPGSTVPAGDVVIAGSAWHQHTGISGVEIAVDGGGWQAAEVADSVTDDSWVQWRATVPLDAGEHQVKVRAIDKAGEVQTGAYADVLPDGATGWDQIGFKVKA